MKVCLLGPVVTSSYYGGVAVFDEELAQGFVDNGWEAVLVTSQKDAVKKDIPLFIATKSEMSEFLNKENPDLIIASLAYARLLPRKNLAKVAYFLHGFFLQSYYGPLKSILASTYQKWLIRRCDYVFANSYFTAMINKEFFGIKADEVFQLGVSNEFLRNSENCDKIAKIPNSIIFAGRLVKAKGVEALIKAVRFLHEEGVPHTLYIAGDGPEREYIERFAKENSLNIILLGRLDSGEMIKWYKKTEVFVSLNPSEPFGIVFPEALICGCKIVCPLTGGQVEYLMDYKESVSFVNENDEKSIAYGLKKMLQSGNSTVSIENCKARFNYKRVALEMIKYIGEK